MFSGSHVLSRQDSGLGVRKRVIKLLTSIFPTVADASIQTDICCRMIDAMNDSDDGVKVTLYCPYEFYGILLMSGSRCQITR